MASTGGHVTFLQGVIALSLIMVIYESLGGLRSVAWTDAIQGVLPLVELPGWHRHLWRDQLPVRRVIGRLGQPDIKPF